MNELESFEVTRKGKLLNQRAREHAGLTEFSSVEILRDPEKTKALAKAFRYIWETEFKENSRGVRD